MNTLTSFACKSWSTFDKSRRADFIAPLLLRIYLAPIFILAGWGKLTALDDTAWYFGEYLGLPMPGLMALLAGLAEFVGGICLLVGFAVRLSAVPLMITMLVAAFSAHWQFGWHALPESTLTVPWEWRTDLIAEANERKAAAISLLKEHGNYAWLSETGSFTVLKNGIEFAATYFLMLLVLFFIGGGRYLAVDWWLARHFACKKSVE
ncbi:DoxX family protein [Agaribacterium haliotis]|uniref:HvfX family Cu-binding RiPP maturation protein n=1 Tax=Agaribacterium haliotis TaxID=2013869 RepID=UPI000BB56608|nr:DoxX family protein [Agaribacterium haliotis]